MPRLGAWRFVFGSIYCQRSLISFQKEVCVHGSKEAAPGEAFETSGSLSSIPGERTQSQRDDSLGGSRKKVRRLAGGRKKETPQETETSEIVLFRIAAFRSQVPPCAACRRGSSAWPQVGGRIRLRQGVPNMFIPFPDRRQSSHNRVNERAGLKSTFAIGIGTHR